MGGGSPGTHLLAAFLALGRRPFGAIGIGANQMVLSSVAAGAVGLGGPLSRASNSISYSYGGAFNSLFWTTPEGFSFELMHYFGENASDAPNSHDGTGDGIRIGYGAGPLALAAATGRTSYVAGNTRQSVIAGSYDFGAAKLIGQFSKDKNGAIDGRGYLIGVNVPIGIGLIRSSYTHYSANSLGDPKTGKLAIGYVHNLSKRTALYATGAWASNSGSAAFSVNGSSTAPAGSSKGFDLGLRHFF